MNLVYIGAGFVGSCSAAVSAESGHDVLVYDIDEKKIKMLGSGDRDTIESCLFEKGLGDLLVRNKERISFVGDYSLVEKFLDDCDAVFMCLPTPEIGETGESDLKFYFAAAEKLAGSLTKRNNGKQEKRLVIVNKSTVPIDMADKTKEIFVKAGVKNFGVVSNPEFLVEGRAIEGSLKPDRVVIGSWTGEDLEIMRQVYRRFYDSPSVKYIEVNPKEAAAGKLLANYYLFNKLMVCFDIIGRTCETFSGLQFENLRRILTSDARIGEWGFYDSLYSGGSCFIKDTRSLAYQLQTAGQNAILINETFLANKRQLELLIGRAEKEAGAKWQGKTVSIFGVAFKRDTNDTRNSPAINIVNFLSEQSVKKIKIFDPAAMDSFKGQFPASEKIEYSASEAEALNEADIIFICTDWPQFRGIGDIIIESAIKPLIIDGRRMLQHQYKELADNGCDVVAVGSPFIKSNLK
ncbi:MAG: nucleotide sugar dehydrogenase [Candidatus Magasanikbacteria bacterium]|nr:nucleotide sugar dehydrogenase [Candidatus Magasanikbacteria bacterium]